MLDKIKVDIIAYNEIADLSYREFEKNDVVMINGEIKNNNIDIIQIERVE